MTEDLLAQLDAQLDELNEQLERLKAARAALAPSKRGRPAKPKADKEEKPAPRRRSTAKKATRTRSNGIGDRQKGKFQTALLEFIQQHPDGVTVPEISQALGCDPKQPYPVLKKAAERGEVVKDDKTWKPISSEKVK